MSFFIDTAYESLNKFNEELCGDKVEIIRNDNSVVIVMADGLGSGVKANILATLTSKMLGTFMVNGLNIDEAVDTIAKTLPVCKSRNIAYSTFSILQLFHSGECYLVEYDNPSVMRFKKGKESAIDYQSRLINGKLIKEGRFSLSADDLLIMVSDGVIHAGIGQTLDLGWQWDNISEYIQKTYRNDMSAKGITKLLLSASDNLYNHKPGDDATVVSIKVKKPVDLNLLVGAPFDAKDDSKIVRNFIEGEGKKIVCGGTTAQIVARELQKEIRTQLEYISPEIPPMAEIEGIDLVTEGVITLRKTLEHIRSCMAPDATMQDFININNKDGASRLAKALMDESTRIHFFVGCSMNPAHQVPESPLNLNIKIKLIEEIANHLKSMGKQVAIEYH